MPKLTQWITGESDVNTRKTRQKRKVTGRSTKEMRKKYASKTFKTSGRGYPR